MNRLDSLLQRKPIRQLWDSVVDGPTRIKILEAADFLTEQLEDLSDLAFRKAIDDILTEDAAVNNAGGGQVAGIGVGPNGEPGVKSPTRNKYKKANKQMDTVNLLVRRRG